MKPDVAEIRRQVAATYARQPFVLPDAWYEEGVAEAMAAWIKRENDLAAVPR